MGNLPCHGLLGASWSKPYLWSGQSLNFTASQNTSSVRHVKNSLCQPSQFVNQKNEALKDLITSPSSTWVRARSCFMFCLVHMGKLCVSHLVISNSLWPRRLQPTRLLCSWDSPRKNTGVGSHSFLQGVCLTHGSNLVSCIAGRFFTVWATGREAPNGKERRKGGGETK